MTLMLTLTLPLTPNQVWPLFKWNVDYIIIGYLARETQALTPNPYPNTYPNPNLNPNPNP